MHIGIGFPFFFRRFGLARDTSGHMVENRILGGVRLNGIRLPEPHSNANLWLVTPKVDITFSKSLFWSTLVQYSNQGKNLGINSRLQWRYTPLSDLYLVYNDNYFTDNFGPRFRSINLKLTYWLNI